MSDGFDIPPPDFMELGHIRVSDEQFREMSDILQKENKSPISDGVNKQSNPDNLSSHPSYQF